jgi:hypothetical protein
MNRLQVNTLDPNRVLFVSQQKILSAAVTARAHTPSEDPTTLQCDTFPLHFRYLSLQCVTIALQFRGHPPILFCLQDKPLDTQTPGIRPPHTRTWTPLHPEPDTRNSGLGHPYTRTSGLAPAITSPRSDYRCPSEIRRSENKKRLMFLGSFTLTLTTRPVGSNYLLLRLLLLSIRIILFAPYYQMGTCSCSSAFT